MIIRPHLNFGSLHRAWQLPGGFILEVWPGSLSPLPDCPPLCGHNGADWIAGGWGRLTAIWNTHVLAPSQLRSVCSPLKVSLDDEPSDKAGPRILTTGKRHEPDFFFPPPPLKWFGWCDRSPPIAEISPGAERGLQWRRRTFFFFFFWFCCHAGHQMTKLWKVGSALPLQFLSLLLSSSPTTSRLRTKVSAFVCF